MLFRSDGDDYLIAGNGVYEQAQKLGIPTRIIESDGKELIVIKRKDLKYDDEKRKVLALADNKTSDSSYFDFAAIVDDFATDTLTDWNFDIDDLQIANIEEDIKAPKGNLKERFIIPPFSILDSKTGDWQKRKKAWLDLGIVSEEGRAEEITYSRSSQSPAVYEARNKIRTITGADPSWDEVFEYCKKHNIPVMNGTSIFDPVLCELSYRWFNVDGGVIIDPFAGGSVRGIVASKLGYPYYGVDLRNEQVKANYENAATVLIDFPEDKIPTWKCGDSLNIDEHLKGVQADMIFSCPPYADLEVYSDDPNDLSTMEYTKFKDIYSNIIRKSCELLKHNRFAIFVVGEVRGKDGIYYNFVQDTINAFQSAGLQYYNEMILVSQVGRLAIRVSNQFNNSRKVGKMHQNVLVFYKGDTKTIKNHYPALDLSYCDMFNEEDKDGKEEQL